MLDPEQFRDCALRPALARLGLGSPAAEALLLGTALVESGLVWLRQRGGGAGRGLYQIEPATHDDIWRAWLAHRPGLRERVIGLAAPGAARVEQLAWNLAYASAIARLVYFRRPEPLPAAHDLCGLAAYWKAHFNTPAGRGRPEDFLARAGPVLAKLSQGDRP